MIKDVVTPIGCDPDIVRNPAQAAGFERNAPSGDSCPRETGARRLAIPCEEFVQTQVVDPFRNRGRDAIDHKRLQSLPQGVLRNHHQILTKGLTTRIQPAVGLE
jgi:hypothetical protein